MSTLTVVLERPDGRTYETNMAHTNAILLATGEIVPAWELCLSDEIAANGGGSGLRVVDIQDNERG